MICEASKFCLNGVRSLFYHRKVAGHNFIMLCDKSVRPCCTEISWTSFSLLEPADNPCFEMQKKGCGRHKWSQFPLTVSYFFNTSEGQKLCCVKHLMSV